ncbi:MAG: hypothetical protein ACPGJV_09355 [Bacteriovoracaceae bacterium]
MDLNKSGDLNLFIKSGLYIFSKVLIHVTIISIATFVHFQLEHDLRIVNSWIVENRWPMAFLVKFLVVSIFVSVGIWNTTKSEVIRKLRSLFIGGPGLGVLWLFLLLSLLLYLNFFSSSQFQILNFSVLNFSMLTGYFLLDTLVFHFLKRPKNETGRILTILLLMGLNCFYLQIADLFQTYFVAAYIIVYGVSLYFVFNPKIPSSFVLALALGSLAPFNAILGEEVLDVFSSEMPVLHLFYFISIGFCSIFFVKATQLASLQKSLMRQFFSKRS